MVGYNIAGKVWQENYGGKNMAGNIWRGKFGRNKSMAGIKWQDIEALAGKWKREINDSRHSIFFWAVTWNVPPLNSLPLLYPLYIFIRQSATTFSRWRPSRPSPGASCRSGLMASSSQGTRRRTLQLAPTRILMGYVKC